MASSVLSAANNCAGNGNLPSVDEQPNDASPGVQDKYSNF